MVYCAANTLFAIYGSCHGNFNVSYLATCLIKKEEGLSGRESLKLLS